MIYNNRCKQRGTNKKILYPAAGGIKMIIINGQVYYYDGYEYVPAGMTEEEFFSQFDNFANNAQEVK